MRTQSIFLVLALAALPVLSRAQSAGGMDPAVLLQPLSDTWPTYSGDYTGRRYSTLAQVDRGTVRSLTLAWVSSLNGTAGGAQTILGGVGEGEYTTVNVKGSIVYWEDMLYVTSADHVWALDARDGRLLWHYFWRTRGGTHTGNRGAAMWHDYLFFETVDNYLVSLDARTGEERWHVEIASFEDQYFSTMAPVAVGDHLLVGTGNDLDKPGFLQSYDPETGELQWKFYTVPMNPGDPGLDTWPNVDAASHGGGQVWIPGSYDPETNLYIFGTGNPSPAYTAVGRAGDNLFTCSLIALNVDTGEMAWHFQTSVHDTHDWDSTQTPILIDGVINGQQRKLVSTAERNGYFFTLDRVTGEHIATSKYGTATNWGLGLRPTGEVEPNPRKEATVPGSLVSPVESGVTNWPPPAYSPQTGLFYVPEHNAFNILYLTDPDPRGSMGLAGKSVAPVGSVGDYITAIDYRTGEVAWRKPIYNGGLGAGLLTTAGGLLFAGDGAGNFMALDSRDGSPLWHTRIGNASNAAQTYLVDGRQHVLVAVGDTLYAFTLY